MQDFEDWIEKNFDREQQSMPGSSISVRYVPKHAVTPPWQEPTPKAFWEDWVRMGTMISIWLAIAAASATALVYV